MPKNTVPDILEHLVEIDAWENYPPELPDVKVDASPFQGVPDVTIFRKPPIDDPSTLAQWILDSIEQAAPEYITHELRNIDLTEDDEDDDDVESDR